LRAAEAPYRVPDQRCKGLAVRVAPSGVKTWDLAYRIRGTGKMRRLSLGRTTDVGLEQARERANELTSAARSGRDLIGEEGEARDAAASRITVGSLIDLYLRRRVVGWPAARCEDDREPSEAHPGAHPRTICCRYLPTRHTGDPDRRRTLGVQESRTDVLGA
jgi:hypothetical protein